MKKLFTIAFIAVSFVACNNGTETKTGEAAGAATEAVSGAAGAVGDSAAALADTAAVKVDSTVKAAVDSVKK